MLCAFVSITKCGPTDMILKSRNQKLILWALLCLGLFWSHASAQTVDPRDKELAEKVVCFESAVEGYLLSDMDDLYISPYFLSEDDLDHWMGQFEFTPEVLAQMSKEDFYAQLKGWAEVAAFTFRDGITGADNVRVVEQRYKYGEQPGLRVSQSVSLQLILYQKEEAVASMLLTLIEMRGKLKLISVK